MLVELQTSECGKSGAPEFRFKVNDAAVLDIDIQWFIDTLHGRVAKGERFRDGETIQLGWGLLKVRSNADGFVDLLEPDYSSLPLEWVDTITQTLRDLRTQKDVCESYFEAEEISFPSLREHCVVCTQLKGSHRIVMERVAASPPDSGWFIGCGDEGHDHNERDHLCRISLYEAVLQNQEARKFLALPPGTLLEAEDRDIQLYHMDALVNPKRGSFIHMLLSVSAVQDPMFGKKKRNAASTTGVFHCSFCNKSQHDVQQLIAGPHVYICNECVAICVDVLAAKRKDPPEQNSQPHSTPSWCALCRLPVTVAEAIAVEKRGLICAGCRSEIEAAIAANRTRG